MRTGVVIAALLLLSSCATAPRNGALKLAETGQAAADGMRGQLGALSASVSRAAGVNSFLKTYEACEQRIRLAGSAAIECAIMKDDPELLQVRDKLVNAIELRRSSLDALSGAYKALRQEAEYDAGADLELATRDATSTASSLLALFSAAPPAAVAALAVKEIPARVARIGAERAQKERLQAASHRIGAAAAMLAQALGEERKVYVSLAGSFAMREAAAREVIISSGAAPRSAALRPLAQSLELDLAPNAEALLGQSLPLRQGAIAHDQALLEARNRQIEESYASAQRALERLARAHSEFDGTGEPRLAEVQRALDELNALLAALKAQKP